MANEHDTKRDGVVSPGDQRPGGAPAPVEQANGAARPAASPLEPGPDGLAGQPASPGAEGETTGVEGETTGVQGETAGVQGETAGVDPGDAATSADSGENHEQLLVRDLEELAARAEKADEYLELAKRTKADFENYRKRAAREAAAAQDRGIAKLAKELLPAVDNLDRAVQAADSVDAPEANGTLVSGIKLVQADVLAALQRAGIERFSPQGEPFDPQRHEAIAQMPVEGAEPGIIVEVYQQGYLLGDAVIRPARVVVAG